MFNKCLCSSFILPYTHFMVYFYGLCSFGSLSFDSIILYLKSDVQSEQIEMHVRFFPIRIHTVSHLCWQLRRIISLTSTLNMLHFSDSQICRRGMTACPLDEACDNVSRFCSRFFQRRCDGPDEMNAFGDRCRDVFAEALIEMNSRKTGRLHFVEQHLCQIL